MGTRGNGKFDVTVRPMGGGFHTEYGFERLKDAVRYAHFQCSHESTMRGVRYCSISREGRYATDQPGKYVYTQTVRLYVRWTDAAGGRVLLSRQPTDHYAWDVAADGVGIHDITEKFDHTTIHLGEGI